MALWAAELRARFPVTESWAFHLNSGRRRVRSRGTRAQAGSGVYASMLTHGDAEWPEMLRGLDEARANVARLAGCDPAELAFTRNTSHSASIAAQMLWDGGHRKAVALEDEFPASTLPFLNRGFDVRFVKSEEGRYPNERIAEALEGRTVLISSHVMYRTGAMLDPVLAWSESPGAARRIVRALRATQSLGALRCRLSCVGGRVPPRHQPQSGMCGGYGAGLIAVRRDLIGKLPWAAVGWLSQRDPDAMRERSSRPVAGGARAGDGVRELLAPILALGAAARGWRQSDPQQVQQRVRALTRLLRDKLRDVGFDTPECPDEELSGITVALFTRAQEASEGLTRDRIAQTPRGVGVRFAVHAFNNEDDLDRAVAGLSWCSGPGLTE